MGIWGKENPIQKISHGFTRKNTESKHTIKSDGNTHPLGAMPKVANGEVAVGLPHRNFSVLKQAAPNKL